MLRAALGAPRQRVRSLLLAPGRIGTLDLPNRIIVTAMGVSLAEPDGQIGDRLIAYHRAQAAGGAGLIVMGVTGIAWPVGAVQPNQTAISDDRFLPGLAQLAEAVHAEGGKIAAQLHHGGLVAAHSTQHGHPLWAPAYPPPFVGDFPDYFLPDEMAAFAGGAAPEIRVLSEADIALAVRQFADAAVRARRAGFDGVEIHGGHGYLLSSFVSPATNTRCDAYGGDLAGRARLLLEVVRAVRTAIGPDFAMWVKIDAREIGRAGGITIEDAAALAPWVEAAGADAITVTAYHDVGQGKLHSASNIPHEPAAHLDAAARIRRAVYIPVIASGRLEIERAERALNDGACDFIAMGRKLLADPSLPAKLAAGRVVDIRPCIYCYTCVSTAYLREQVRCAVRPETGFEDLDWTPAAAPAHVVVVGGGPAGMEAARRLDMAGTRVTLIERSARLGGTLRVAGLAYEPNERLLDWLRSQIAKSGVEIQLSTEATSQLIADLGPDRVIVATGAVRDMPPIMGAERDHVLSGDDLRALMFGDTSDAVRRKIGRAGRIVTRLGAATGATANLDLVRQATRLWMPLGKRVVIIGGELVGCELAEFLVARGRHVTLIDDPAKMGGGLLLVRRMRLLADLKEHGVAMFPGARGIAIDSGAVRFTDADGALRRVPADHVIMAKGARGDSTLADTLRAVGLTVDEIGDGIGVGYIEGAMRGAAALVASYGR